MKTNVDRRAFLKGILAAAALVCCPVVGGSLPAKAVRMHLVVTWRSGGLSHVTGGDVMVTGSKQLRAIKAQLEAGMRRDYYEAFTMVRLPA